MHHYKPTCIYFLDEIDAALDHRNVAILGAFVLQKARDAQFIIISLRNQLFELANRLVRIPPPLPAAALPAALPVAVAAAAAVVGVSAAILVVLLMGRLMLNMYIIYIDIIYNI